MNIPTIAASVLSLGLLASGAFAANSGNAFCGKGTYYDNSTLTCVDNNGFGSVNETAGISVPSETRRVKNSEIGDFIDETTSERSERTSR